MKELILYAGGFILAIFLAVYTLRFMIRKRHIFLNAALGLAGLAGVNLLSGITGINIGYSILSVGISFVLGLPGVAFLIVEKLI